MLQLAANAIAMNTSTRKFWSWAVLACGGGGLVYFLLLCLHYGAPPHGIYYLWPAIAVALCSVAALRLKKLYQLEPVPERVGVWQLTLTDLLAATVLVGA